MHDRRLAFLRASAWLAFTLIMLVPALLAAPVLGRAPKAIARFWNRGTARLTGLVIRVHGTPSRQRPTLFVANHVSYLDIVALASTVDAAFIAKSEVRRWPGIGLIARLGRTLFVERQRRLAGRQRDAVAARLGSGDNLVLFAEGTSSDGGRVLPFKSALFAAVLPRGLALDVMVQPVTIAYPRFRGGLAIGHAFRPCYGWYGDMDLLPHLWHALGLPGAEIELHFHPPRPAGSFASRKTLAREAERDVAAGLAAIRQAA